MAPGKCDACCVFVIVQGLILTLPNRNVVEQPQSLAFLYVVSRMSKQSLQDLSLFDKSRRRPPKSDGNGKIKISPGNAFWRSKQTHSPNIRFRGESKGQKTSDNGL